MQNGGYPRVEPDGAKHRREVASEDASSVVLIGMRGAGKTSLGEAAAKLSGWRFVDLDQWFEKTSGQKISQLVAEKGMAAFRQAELETLQKALKEYPTKTVLACGGGIVETPAALAALEEWFPVVHICKPIQDCEKALAADPNRMKLPEPLQVLWDRRTPLYQRACDFEFNLRLGEQDWTAAGVDFSTFLQRATGVSPSPRYDEDSFFLSLTFPDVSKALSLLPIIGRGVDALELRVDLLESQDIEFVKDQIATLRRATTLPIVYTLRSKAQGGAFSGTAAQAVQLLTVGLQSTCEFVDVEADLDKSLLVPLLKKRRSSLIIGSHHDMARMPPFKECEEMLKSCLLDGVADIAKLVVGTSKPEDCFALQQAAARLDVNVPFILINAGEMGKMSRLLNRIFTPVNHPALPFTAAPGQMSAESIMESRKTFGYCEPKTWYIFGSPVGGSPSPTIHNAVFTTNLAPHKYERYDSPDALAAVAVLKSPTCGGGSVTIPLKEMLPPHMAHLSEAAKAIGAINTVTNHGGILHGDNTDWLGIKRQFERKLKSTSKGSGSEPRTALILGAGGTARAACYALKAMGCSPVLIYNRTESRAEQLAKEFGVEVCKSILADDLLALARLDLVMGTVPGAGEMTLPESVLTKFKPICFDAAYRPRDTALLRSAAASNCPTIEGVEMLFEQGCAQCQIWTRRSAPRKEIAEAMIRDCFSEGESIPEGLSCEVK